MSELEMAWGIIEAIASGLDDVKVTTLACMLIDYAAVKNDMTSLELIEKITPLIKVCNEQLGAMEI